MGRRLTLREILRRTLLGSPLAFAMLGGTSCGGGPCGSHVVIIDTAPKPIDGGIDCSVCGRNYASLSCNPVTVNGSSQVACNVQN
jgi:hypothetical protein